MGAGEAASTGVASAAAPVIVAPAPWRRIDFISDLHLTEDRAATFDAFDRVMRHTTADAVFILGDLFEVWVGDDVRFSPFEARCADTLRAATARRSVAFMVGNRDFLVGHDLLDACGVTALQDPTVLSAFGERLLLTHGDAWCVDDVDYQRFRAQVRDPGWQREVLARPLAQRLALAAAMRAESERRHDNHAAELWADVDRSIALREMASSGARQLIHGHTHRPATEALAPGRVRHVLSDWELDDPAQAPRAEVLRWTASGIERLSVDVAVAAAA